MKKWDAIRASYGFSHDAFRVKIARFNAKNGTSFTYKNGGDCSEQEYEQFVKIFGSPNTPEHARTQAEQNPNTPEQFVRDSEQNPNTPEQSEQFVRVVRTDYEQIVRDCSDFRTRAEQSEQSVRDVRNRLEQARTDLNKSEQVVQVVRNNLNKSEQARTESEQARTRAEQVVRDLRNELIVKDLQMKNALDKSSLPEDLKKELVVLRSENSDLKSEKVRIETELQFQKEKIKELQGLNDELKLGVINVEHDKNSTSEKLQNLSRANRENLEELMKVKLENLEIIEKLKVLESKNSLFESEKNNLGNFVKLLTDKYKGLFVAIGYLSVMSMFIVGKYEYITFEAIFGYLKIPFASLFALAMIVFFQGRFVDDIGLTCFNIALYGSRAKSQAEKILNFVSIGFGVSIVALMFLTAQRIWNTPQPKAQFDPSQIAKIQKKYELDSTKCAFQFAKDSAKIVDSIGFENQRRNVLKAKIWCNEGCKKTYSDSNTVALNSQRSKLSQADCGLNLRNLESKRDSDIANLKPIAQIDNRFFGLFIYLLFVAIRIVEILVKAIRVKEGVLIAPKRARIAITDFLKEIKNRV